MSYWNKKIYYLIKNYIIKKINRKDDGMLRTMTSEKLLKTLPILQKQLDALVQFDVSWFIYLFDLCVYLLNLLANHFE